MDLRPTLQLLLLLSLLDLCLCVGTKQTDLATLSTTLLSMSSSILGYVLLSWRSSIFDGNEAVSKRDIVVLTRNGGFGVIKCSKEVEVELEERDHRTTKLMISMLISIASTIPTPSSTVLNSFVKRNGMPSAASLVNLIFVNFSWGPELFRAFFRTPESYICEVPASTDYQVIATSGPETPRHESPAFLTSLWYTIRETKRTDWVQAGNVVPDTAHWRRWLEEAEENAKNETRDWDAAGRKCEIDSFEVLDDLDETADTQVKGTLPTSLKKLITLLILALSTRGRLFLNLKGSSWWKYMFRPAVPPGHERLEWICVSDDSPGVERRDDRHATDLSCRNAAISSMETSSTLHWN